MGLCQISFKGVLSFSSVFTARQMEGGEGKKEMDEKRGREKLKGFILRWLLEIGLYNTLLHSFPGGSEVKESACNVGDPDPWVRKIRWRRKWQPTPVFLPGESHGQRSLVGYSPQGHKELDTTE